jgi:hypothetical protein
MAWSQSESEPHPVDVAGTCVDATEEAGECVDAIGVAGGCVIYDGGGEE